MRDWGYPIDPLPNDVVYQQTLRRNRESGRRFVQAAGTLARALGGKMQTPSGATSPLMSQFSTIETRANDLPLSQSEHFGYDFLKAILLWLESGVGRLLEGFTRPDDMSPSSKAAGRLPIPESDATPEAIDDILVPYLLNFARDKPIANVEANRFEHEGTRHLFASEKSAVLAFAAAVKIPFTDLSSGDAHAEISDPMQAQHRQTAFRFWGLKAARGVLINAAEGVNYVFVDRAFGGLGRVVQEAAEEEAGMESISEGEDEPIVDAQVVERRTDDDAASPCAREMTPTIEESHTLAEREAMHEAVSADLVAEMMQESEDEQMGEDDESDGIDDNDEYNEVFDSEDGFQDDEDDDDDDDDDDDEDGDEDEDDDLPNNGLPRFMYRSAFERRRIREKVASHVPCSSHQRVYRGHCNVKTVKDVNFFGLDDEYIVSGSDDGNLFIWDRKTTQLVNILEGDGEVVNVAQGHPYETMLAVSGIDHTIKIFSPDARAREAARLGRGVEAHDASEFSSIAWPPRSGGRRRASRRSTSHSESGGATSEPAMDRRDEDDENDEDDYVAPSGLASRRRLHESYQIMQQNDVERQGGNQDAFVTVS
jgi:nuclear receptor interaction protein